MTTYISRICSIALSLLVLGLFLALALEACFPHKAFGQEKGRQTLVRTHWPLPDTTAHWVKPKLAVNVIDQIRENLKQQDVVLAGWRQIFAGLPQDSILVNDEAILRTLGIR